MKRSLQRYTLFQKLKKVVPTKCTIAIVTDRERANTTAISTEVPTVLQQFCWNHILQDVQRWLTAHGASRTNNSAMIGHLRILFNQSNLMEYKSTLHVNKEVGRWRSEGAGVHTHNQSESLLHRVIKSLQNWKEAPADMMLTALYQLQQFHINEMQRRLVG
jgi:hypothetical protein